MTPKAMLTTIYHKYIKYIQDKIDLSNRKRLKNPSPSLICSNCAGGYLYHFLRLKFYSPFINLYLTNSDFIYMMENWNHFISSPLVQDLDSNEPYPIGIGWGGIKIHFLHYHDWNEAILKWEERKKRIDSNNIGFALTNLKDDNEELVHRFAQIPIKNKIVFTNNPYPQYECAVYIKGFQAEDIKKQLWSRISKMRAKRLIDQFDYVSWINNLPHNKL